MTDRYRSAKETVAYSPWSLRGSFNPAASRSRRAALLAEARKRRFHMIETGDQVVILCNTEALEGHG